MNITPLKPASINLKNITFSEPKSLDSGAKLVFMNYGRSPIYVQTPEFEIPFDTGSFYEDKPGTGKYAIKVSLNGHDSDPKVKEFHDMLAKLDEQLVNTASQNGPQWFKKKQLSPEVAKELYTKMLRVSVDEDGEPDGRYPPSFAFKIVKRDGKVHCKVFDEEHNEINVDSTESETPPLDLETAFKKNTKVKMLLKCNGVWIASGKFGYTWRAEQIRIKMPASFDNYAFLPSDDEDCGDVSTEQKKDLIESSDEDTSNVSSESDNEEVVVKKPRKNAKK